MANYLFPQLNNDQVIEDVTWSIEGLSSVEYIDGVSQDGFKSNIRIVRGTDGKVFRYPLYNELERPVTMTVEDLRVWIENELINFEV